MQVISVDVLAPFLASLQLMSWGGRWEYGLHSPRSVETFLTPAVLPFHPSRPSWVLPVTETLCTTSTSFVCFSTTDRTSMSGPELPPGSGVACYGPCCSLLCPQFPLRHEIAFTMNVIHSLGWIFQGLGDQNIFLGIQLHSLVFLLSPFLL